MYSVYGVHGYHMERGVLLRPYYTGTVYLHYTLYTLHAVCNKVYTVLTNMERWEDFPTKNNKNVNYLFSLFKIIESSLDRCLFLGTNMMSLGDS